MDGNNQFNNQYNSPPNNNQYNNPYNNTYSNQYVNNLYDKPMRLQDWIIMMLLFMIPIANIVLLFVWAFGSNVNKSKKTFCQAVLIMSLVGIVLSILLYSSLIGLFLAFFSALY